MNCNQTPHSVVFLYFCRCFTKVTVEDASHINTHPEIQLLHEVTTSQCNWKKKQQCQSSLSSLLHLTSDRKEKRAHFWTHHPDRWDELSGAFMWRNNNPFLRHRSSVCESPVYLWPSNLKIAPSFSSMRPKYWFSPNFISKNCQESLGDKRYMGSVNINDDRGR